MGPAHPALAALTGFSVVAFAALLALWAGFTAQLRTERDRADEQRMLAEESERTARRLLYAAHMNLAQRAWNEVQVPRMIELLEEYHKPGVKDLRGLEWYYLWRLGHGELAIDRGHTGGVWSVAFSPNGRRLVSAGEDSHGPDRRPRSNDNRPVDPERPRRRGARCHLQSGRPACGDGDLGLLPGG